MNTPWNIENKVWLEQRTLEWDLFGKDIQQAMIDADEFRYGPYTPDDYQNYFMTGHIPTGMTVPIHFRIMSYPVADDVSFVTRCFDELTDVDLEQFVRQTKRCYYKNNKSFAQVYLSENFTSRLTKLNLKQMRDEGIIKSQSFSRIIAGLVQPDDIDVGFDVYYSDSYVSIALECIQSEHNSVYGLIRHLMHLVAHFVEPIGIPGDESIARQYAELFFQKFECELPEEHMLKFAWVSEKSCRYKLGADRWTDGSYDEEERKEVEKEIRDEIESETRLTPRISKMNGNYRALVSQLITYFKEYDFCDKEEPFDIWSAVDLSDILSDGAKQYFSLSDKPVLAYSYTFKISNCAFAANSIDRDDLASIGLYLIPANTNASIEIDSAAILVGPRNGLFQIDYDFPNEMIKMYHRIFRWCNNDPDAGIYRYKADRNGESNISQSDREDDLREFGLVYEGFDLMSRNFNYLEQNNIRETPWNNSEISEIKLSLES